MRMCAWPDLQVAPQLIPDHQRHHDERCVHEDQRGIPTVSAKFSTDRATKVAAQTSSIEFEKYMFSTSDSSTSITGDNGFAARKTKMHNAEMYAAHDNMSATVDADTTTRRPSEAAVISNDERRQEEFTIDDSHGSADRNNAVDSASLHAARVTRSNHDVMTPTTDAEFSRLIRRIVPRGADPPKRARLRERPPQHVMQAAYNLAGILARPRTYTVTTAHINIDATPGGAAADTLKTTTNSESCTATATAGNKSNTARTDYAEGMRTANDLPTMPTYAHDCSAYTGSARVSGGSTNGRLFVRIPDVTTDARSVQLQPRHSQGNAQAELQGPAGETNVDKDECYEVSNTLTQGANNSENMNTAKVQCRVRWKDGGPEHDTWEENENLTNARRKIGLFEKAVENDPAGLEPKPEIKGHVDASNVGSNAATNDDNNADADTENAVHAGNGTENVSETMDTHAKAHILTRERERGRTAPQMHIGLGHTGDNAGYIHRKAKGSMRKINAKIDPFKYLLPGSFGAKYFAGDIVMRDERSRHGNTYAWIGRNNNTGWFLPAMWLKRPRKDGLTNTLEALILRITRSLGLRIFPYLAARNRRLEPTGEQRDDNQMPIRIGMETKYSSPHKRRKRPSNGHQAAIKRFKRERPSSTTRRPRI